MMRTYRTLALFCGGDSQIGGEIGGAIGTVAQAVIPIPGIGAVIGFAGSAIGSLLGPSAHYTPSGLTYDNDMHAFMESYFNMIAITNQVRSAMRLPPVKPLPFVGEYTPTPNFSGNIGATNAPYFGPYLAKLLNNNSYAGETTETDLTNFEKTGVLDAARSVQDALSQELQFVLDSLEVGELQVSNGQLVTNTGQAAVDANSWAQVQGQANSAAASSCSPGVSLAVPSAFLAANGGYVLAGLGVLGLLILLKKRAG